MVASKVTALRLLEAAFGLTRPSVQSFPIAAVDAAFGCDSGTLALAGSSRPGHGPDAGGEEGEKERCWQIAVHGAKIRHALAVMSAQNGTTAKDATPEHFDAKLQLQLQSLH